MAQRIGNLLGRLKFSDDQLQQTQKGLKDAGVAMPNFGNVGRELAKEINEEPEVEVETEDERAYCQNISCSGFTLTHRARSAASGMSRIHFGPSIPCERLHGTESANKPTCAVTTWRATYHQVSSTLSRRSCTALS